MKILIDSTFFGGSGGIEKLTKDLISSKKDEIFIDLFVSSGINNEKSFKAPNFRFVNLEDIGSDYDYFLKVGMHFNNNLQDRVKKECIKLVCPAGYVNKNFPIHAFNYLWEESPDSYPLQENIKLFTACVPMSIKYDKPSTNHIVESLNKEFYVTIANDYDPHIKGIDLIYKFAEISGKELVWFCSDNKNQVIHLKEQSKTPGNLKIARNISRNLILDTLEKSCGYISFSRSEGSGFSIAEAIMLKKPIFTQKVGLIKYFPNDFVIYNNIEEIKNINLNYKYKNYENYEILFSNFWEKLFALT
jgi:hypothetical protein